MHYDLNGLNESLDPDFRNTYRDSLDMRALNQNPEDEDHMMDFHPLDKNLDYCGGELEGDEEEVSFCSDRDKHSLRKTLEESQTSDN